MRGADLLRLCNELPRLRVGDVLFDVLRPAWPPLPPAVPTPSIGELGVIVVDDVLAVAEQPSRGTPAAPALLTLLFGAQLLLLFVLSIAVATSCKLGAAGRTGFWAYTMHT